MLTCLTYAYKRFTDSFAFISVSHLNGKAKLKVDLPASSYKKVSLPFFEDDLGKSKLKEARNGKFKNYETVKGS